MDCTIVSLYPGDLEEFKPGVIPNIFKISGARTPGDFTVTPITDAAYRTDPINGRPSIMVPILAKDLAYSLVNDFLGAKIGVDPNGKKPGIFVLEGTYTKEQIQKDTKLKAQLDIAKKQQDDWFLDQVLVADGDWARKKSHMVITQDAKWAAKWLNIEREWTADLAKLQAQNASKLCAGCATEIPQVAIICRYCQTVQDQERYKNLKRA